MPDNKLAQVRTISYSLEMFQFKTKMTTSRSSNALGYNQYRQSRELILNFTINKV